MPANRSAALTTCLVLVESVEAFRLVGDLADGLEEAVPSKYECGAYGLDAGQSGEGDEGDGRVGEDESVVWVKAELVACEGRARGCREGVKEGGHVGGGGGDKRDPLKGEGGRKDQARTGWQ